MKSMGGMKKEEGSFEEEESFERSSHARGPFFVSRAPATMSLTRTMAYLNHGGEVDEDEEEARRKMWSKKHSG